eukprot:COSAG01_NODE_537_length_15764_cov_54.273795_3_plen_142_part_00
MLVTECSHGGDTSRTRPAGRARRRPPCDHADRSLASSAVQPSCVFLVNCGAMVNLEQWLSLGEYPGLVMCVADSHRPVDLSNLDADEDSNYKVRHRREIYTNSTTASATALSLAQCQTCSSCAGRPPAKALAVVVAACLMG